MTLAFPKPTKRSKPRRRSTGSAELADYSARHPHCEVRGCTNPPCPEPHHILPRGGLRGRIDAAWNLIRLCWSHHAQYHRQGWSRWLDVLAASAAHLREKIERAHEEPVA